MGKGEKEEMESPEQKARKAIDERLQQAGWLVQDVARTNLDAGRGIAIREFPLKSGYGFAARHLPPLPPSTGLLNLPMLGACSSW